MITPIVYYAGIKNLAIDLHPAITAFIGPNGCGKTRVLRGLTHVFHGRVSYYDFDENALCGDAHRDWFGMSSNGDHLPAALYRLRSQYPERFKWAMEGAQALVPELQREGVHVKQEGYICSIGTQNDLPLGKAAWFALGIFTALYAPRDFTTIPRHLLLFDDLERHIYPRHLHILNSHLNLAIDRQPGLQIAFSTSSSDLLDCLQPEQVRFLWSEDGGQVRCVSMEEHPDFPRWSDTMTAGEMWAVLGR